MTLPNLITIGRLVLVPAVVVMINQGSWATAFALFVLAGISDAADGLIARRYGLRSELGAYLDPLADKALLVSIYVALAVQGVLPGWLAIVVVSRDAMIFAAIVVSWLMHRPVAIRPLLISKLNTAAQIAFAALVGLVVGILTRRDGGRAPTPRGPARALAAVGERSLTCYLLQSVLLAPLLSAWGLGLADGIGTAVVAGVCVAVWLVTVALAVVLDRAGRRGPAELLLRRLVYGPPAPASAG